MPVKWHKRSSEVSRDWSPPWCYPQKRTKRKQWAQESVLAALASVMTVVLPFYVPRQSMAYPGRNYTQEDKRWDIWERLCIARVLTSSKCVAVLQERENKNNKEEGREVMEKGRERSSSTEEGRKAMTLCMQPYVPRQTSVNTECNYHTKVHRMSLCEVPS